jgi:hypothetical protein
LSSIAAVFWTKTRHFFAKWFGQKYFQNHSRTLNRFHIFFHLAGGRSDSRRREEHRNLSTRTSMSCKHFVQKTLQNVCWSPP